MKITKRDIGFFGLGFLALLIIEVIVDWDSFKDGFKDGFKDATHVESVE